MCLGWRVTTPANDATWFTSLTESNILRKIYSMITDLKMRPFTEALDDVRSHHRYTYQELSIKSGGVRSQAWFHKQLNLPPRVNSVPVGEDVWFGLADLLGVSVGRVCELIAEEWLGVRHGPVSPRAAVIGPDLVHLYEEDFQLLRQMAIRLPKEDPFADRESSADGESDGPGHQ